ncbi:hypothetical protein HK097_010681 [Rhizophlyctis rosea]|uniref:Uncharacterized protein n=1 Tax=Rhizophlyctis rosea TaxID=64517 RepID=A0AAD5SA00_9FUNG|nr:hypothetical protein HK097_010681 [Rhizophlyctis rosea]
MGEYKMVDSWLEGSRTIVWQGVVGRDGVIEDPVMKKPTLPAGTHTFSITYPWNLLQPHIMNPPLPEHECKVEFKFESGSPIDWYRTITTGLVIIAPKDSSGGSMHGGDLPPYVVQKKVEDLRAPGHTGFDAGAHAAIMGSGYNGMGGAGF